MAQSIAPLKIKELPKPDLLMKVTVASPPLEHEWVVFLAGAAGNDSAGVVPCRIHFIVCHEIHSGAPQCVWLR